MDIQLTPITQSGKRAFSQLINLYNFNYDFTNYLNDDIPENGFFYGDADYYMNSEKVLGVLSPTIPARKKQVARLAFFYPIG